MLRRVFGRWRGGLSLGLGLPLLLGSTPAAAAGGLDIGIGALTTWLGIVATLWAVVVSRAVPQGGLALIALAALGVTMAIGFRRLRLARLAGGSPIEPTGDLPAACAALPLAIPAGLDSEAVLDAARARFLRLQAAWDAGDVSTLKSLTTPDMLEELLHVLTARGGAASRTDVITLHAELLGLEELSAAYLASVEFSGLIRESEANGAVPFRELWMLACMKEGAPSWRLARQQSLF